MVGAVDDFRTNGRRRWCRGDGAGDATKQTTQSNECNEQGCTMDFFFFFRNTPFGDRCLGDVIGDGIGERNNAGVNSKRRNSAT